jgi:hypothetical protein
MPKGLVKSVGKGGANEWRDVKLVQLYLNSYDLGKHQPPELAADGKMGANTLKAIEIFQKYAVGMAKPDMRVDPNGKTFRYLTMFHSQAAQQRFEDALTRTSGKNLPAKITKKVIRSKAGLAGLTVTYNGVEDSKQKVSEYAKDVIKLALKESGMTTAVITSTMRTPKEQATIMLRNAKKNYKKQFQLYRTEGQEVLKVYDANKTLSDEKITNLMVEKIESLEKEGRAVSSHCITEKGYKKRNIIDIGVGSTRALNANFNKEFFTNALENLKKEGFIARLIDETNKSNNCWHVEIIPNVKSIPGYSPGLLLNPIIYINGSMLA